MSKSVVQKGNGPRLSKRVETLKLPAPYEGFTFQAWVNAPAKLWQTLLNQSNQGVTEEEIAAELAPIPLEEATAEQVDAATRQLVEAQEAVLMDVLSQLIVGHNGWMDYDGQPLPEPSEAEFYELIPTELLAAMIATMQDVQKKVAASVRTKKKRR